MLGLKPSTLEPAKDGLAQRWRDKTIGEITVDDMDAVLAEIRTKGVPGLRQRVAVSDSAARVAFLRYNKFFAWTIERRLATTNPCVGVARPPPGSSRERVLSDVEIRQFWHACGRLPEPFGAALRVMLVTGQRRGEVGAMRWAELDGDMWHLPAERSKNGKAHTVPLSGLALELIHGVTRAGAEFVFSTTGDVPVSGWSKTKRRLDALMPNAPPFTIHDLRRTTATNLQKLGVKLEVTEACLNHSGGSRGGIVGVYQRHQYGEEKRDALNRWAERVAEITSA
jgi:integrase